MKRPLLTTQMLTAPRATLIAFGLTVATIVGCGSGYSALSPGNAMPSVEVAGWTHDDAPESLEGKVVVIEAFATW